MTQERNRDSHEQQRGRKIEQIYREWDEALGAKDVDAAIALYAADCELESPLVRQLVGSADGVVAGKERLRQFVQMVFAHQPAARQRYRKGFFTDGRTLVWEYPRKRPDGEQMDFVEVMEIKDGLIHRHRVYWGWYGLKLLEDGAMPARPTQ